MFVRIVKLEYEQGVQNKKNTQTGVFDSWQGHLCNSRIDFMRELLLFGKDIKVFLMYLLKNHGILRYNE